MRGPSGAHGTVFLLGFRFIFGVRIATPLVLGAGSFPATRFALMNAAGAAAWSLTFGGLGWLLTTVLQRPGRVEELIAAGVILAVRRPPQLRRS